MQTTLINVPPEGIAAACRAAAQQGELEEICAAAMRKADANALAPWAPLTTDWDKVRGPVSVATQIPKRQKTVSEVMQSTLGTGKAPCMAEVMQLLLNVAYGDHAPTREQARRLVRRMATEFAEMGGAA
jgi:hypothetical protein